MACNKLGAVLNYLHEVQRTVCDIGSCGDEVGCRGIVEFSLVDLGAFV